MRKIFKLSLLLLCLISLAMLESANCWAAQTREPDRMTVVQYPMEEFLIPQIQGMTDRRLQDKINRELRGSILNLYDPSHYTSLRGNFEVSFYNGNLLGIHFKGISYAVRAAHPQKIDVGIHIDLTTGMIYELNDLFLAGVNYERILKERCRMNQESYRLAVPGLWDGWTYDEFERNWKIGPGGEFLLSAQSMRLYTLPAHVTGFISGYAVPYSAIMDIIDQNGPLWKVLQSHEPMPVKVEAEKMGIDDFTLRDFDVRLGDMANWVVAKLGEPKSKEPVQGGLSYDYGELEIIVNSQNTVVNILTDHQHTATRRWVHPGQSIATVKERYGDNVEVTSYGEYELYEYSCRFGSETHILRFAVKHGSDQVSYISCRIAE